MPPCGIATATKHQGSPKTPIKKIESHIDFGESPLHRCSILVCLWKCSKLKNWGLHGPMNLHKI